jgi:CheY-like chemotaxis protein
MDQVLMNLATNARDAMPGGGRLTIEAAEIELDNAFINTHGYGQPGAYVLISVSDTGTGMDEATKERIFDPFFTTKEVGKGTGLGLSTVYGIIKQHNGYIEVQSEPGQGTTFGIYFPVVNAKEQTKESALFTARGGAETVLVAEDNLAVRSLTREILTMSGYTVIEAVDGEDAVQKFMEHSDAIAIVILDVVMPKKNGKEVYEEIGKLRPGIKVIFTSGYTGDVVLDKGIRDDMFDFIKKPLLPDELLLKVRTVLDR